MSWLTQVIADGATAAWPMDETSGSTAFDQTGNGHDLSFSTGLTARLGANLGMRFNGGVGSVAADPALVLPTSGAQFSLVASVTPRELTTALLAQWPSFGAAAFYTEVEGTGTWRGQPGNGPTLTSTGLVTDGLYHYITLTFDIGADTAILYIDGVIDSTMSGLAGVSDCTGFGLTFGGSGFFTDGYQGVVANMAVFYGTVLTQPQIVAQAALAFVPIPVTVHQSDIVRAIPADALRPDAAYAPNLLLPWAVIGGPPGPPDPIISPPALTVNGAASGSGMAGGLWEIDPDVAPIVAVVVDRADMSTVVGTLDYSHDRTWTETINDPGSGQVELDAFDDDRALLTTDTAVQFRLYGKAVFTMLVEDADQMTVAPNEEVDETDTVTGRSNLALLEEALVYPSRGVGAQPTEEARAFNWTSPNTVYDDSGWRHASIMCSVLQATTVWPLLPFAQGFPDDIGAQVIWASSGTTLQAPVGTCYFRRTITIGTDGYYQLYALADNDGLFYLDGQPILTLGGFSQVYTYLIYLTAGEHTFAASVTNEPLGVPGVLPNPAGLVFALFESDASGAINTVIAVSDSNWLIVEYPPFPPGMTPGAVMKVVLDEAQARGALAGMTPTFDPFVDTAGNPWPEVTDIATNVGTDLLSFFIEIGNTYIDWATEPGSLNLNAWNLGGRGVASGVAWVASRTVLDGAGTGGSTMIESATADFQPYDVGRRITGDSIGADATIATVVDATHATITVPLLATIASGVWSIEGTIQSLEHTRQF